MLGLNYDDIQNLKYPLGQYLEFEREVASPNLPKIEFIAAQIMNQLYFPYQDPGDSKAARLNILTTLGCIQIDLALKAVDFFFQRPGNQNLPNDDSISKKMRESLQDKLQKAHANCVAAATP